MTHIKFNPWIGNNYSQAPLGKKVLVLGESHYDWEQDSPIDHSPTVTNEVISEQLDGHYTKAFWTHITITFLNKLPTLDDKREFWHAVSFYNYVQQSAGMGARVPPSSEMFQASEPAFFEVLESLKPEVVVVLGYRLWQRLPKQTTEDETIETQSGPILTRRYSYVGGTCLACSIKHPSSGFNGRDWHSRVMTVIRSATT